VAVVDIGTNSTRLLIADVTLDGGVAEVVRRSVVTRLGAGVDADGSLSREGCERVLEALREFRAEIDAYAREDTHPRGREDKGEDAHAHTHEEDTGGREDKGEDAHAHTHEEDTGGREDKGEDAHAHTHARAQARKDDQEEQERAGSWPNLAVMTSAVREARNGREFAERVRRECGLDARILTGEEEARMTFLGAMSGRSGAMEPTVVIDIGGGSTEFVVGVGRSAGFHVSLPAGVVRMSERHIHSDPPRPAELQELAGDTRTTYLAGLPASERAPVRRGIAVAGTATSAAAIDQELEPYDPERVHGYPLLLATVEMLLARLADMDEAQRRAVAGLDPNRAPTIVAGMVLLSEAMRAFALEEVEVSEHDILHGGALSLAENNNSGPHRSSDI
jgi:exopolyphosphatase/guanosine-5'-triphosphate,3'-diphosphate pyrophosphatase